MRKYKMKRLILIIGIASITSIEAQILSGGIFRNQVLKSNLGSFSTHGIELNNTHYLFAVNSGMGWGNTNNNTSVNTRYIGVEYTPTGFHYAYLANRIAPFIGLKLYKNVIKEKNEFEEQVLDNKTIDNQYALNFGLKYSNNRVITSGEFILGKNEKMIAFKLSYVLWVTHKCVRKRILDKGTALEF